MSVFARNSIWDSLLVQLCDLFEVHKAEQSVLCSDLPNSVDWSILVKLVSVQFESLCGKSICNPEMLYMQTD